MGRTGCWIAAVLVLVIVLCAWDLHCSGSSANTDMAVGVRRVKRELAAGRQELAQRRVDALNLQIRDLRVMARRMVKDGRSAEARRLFAAIAELEKQAEAASAVGN